MKPDTGSRKLEKDVGGFQWEEKVIRKENIGWKEKVCKWKRSGGVGHNDSNMKRKEKKEVTRWQKKKIFICDHVE